MMEIEWWSIWTAIGNFLKILAIVEIEVAISKGLTFQLFIFQGSPGRSGPPGTRGPEVRLVFLGYLKTLYYNGICVTLKCFIQLKFMSLHLRGGGGVLKVYMTGGPTELHIANPKNTQVWNFRTKKIPGKCTLYCSLNINSFFGTHITEKQF